MLVLCIFYKTDIQLNQYENNFGCGLPTSFPLDILKFILICYYLNVETVC